MMKDSICEQISMLAKDLKGLAGRDLVSCTIKGEWKKPPLGSIEITCALASGRKELLDVLREILPYVTIIIIASIVGCCFKGRAVAVDAKKMDSEVQVQNVQMSASMRIDKEVGK